MSSQRVTLYNRTDRPVLIDADGHTLGGGEYRSVREDEAATLRAVATGAAVVVTDPGGDLAGLRPDAAEAIKVTRKANGHRKPKASDEPASADSNDGDENKGA